MSDWAVKVDDVIIEKVEVRSVKWGYTFPRSCTLFFPGRHDEGIAELTNNNEIKISNDDFVTLVFSGRLETNSPMGVASDGIEYQVIGLEGLLNRFICKFNGTIDYTYNIDGLPDYNSPNLGGERWTVGQIMVDILEHALGLSVDIDNGEVITTISQIPLHHPISDPNASSPVVRSVTNPYVNEFETILNTYSAAAILALELELDEFRVNSQRLWDVLQSLVQKMDYHGLYMDPSDPDNPTLVLHDFTTSTGVNLVCGVIGSHIEDTEASAGSPMVENNRMRFDISRCRTKIIIEGKGIIKELIPISQGGTKNGIMVPHWEESGGDAGTRWIVKDTMLFTPLWEGKLSNLMQGPILILDGVPCHADFADWNLKTGVVSTEQDLRDFTSVEVWSLYLARFQVIAGPGGTAYDNYGLIAEAAFYDDSMLHPSHPACDRYNLITTFNEGTLESCVYGEYTQETSGEEYCAPLPPRDDTAVMQAIADAMLNQMGDEKVFGTVTLDGIDLSEFTLLKEGNFTGLSKWSTLGAQVMAIEIKPEEDTMICEISNDVFQMPGYAEWKRRYMMLYNSRFQRRLIDSLRHHINVGGSSRFAR